ncbi:hypothetical protein CTI14_66800, partial [Methylobacterium radiotolerans]
GIPWRRGSKLTGEAPATDEILVMRRCAPPGSHPRHDLDGVPTTIKELTAVKGHPVAAGLEAHRRGPGHRRDPGDAALRAAGQSS